MGAIRWGTTWSNIDEFASPEHTSGGQVKVVEGSRVREPFDWIQVGSNHRRLVIVTVTETSLHFCEIFSVNTLISSSAKNHNFDWGAPPP